MFRAVTKLTIMLSLSGNVLQATISVTNAVNPSISAASTMADVEKTHSALSDRKDPISAAAFPAIFQPAQSVMARIVSLLIFVTARPLLATTTLVDNTQPAPSLAQLLKPPKSGVHVTKASIPTLEMVDTVSLPTSATRLVATMVVVAQTPLALTRLKIQLSAPVMLVMHP